MRGAVRLENLLTQILINAFLLNEDLRGWDISIHERGGIPILDLPFKLDEQKGALDVIHALKKRQ